MDGLAVLLSGLPVSGFKRRHRRFIQSGAKSAHDLRVTHIALGVHHKAHDHAAFDSGGFGFIRVANVCGQRLHPAYRLRHRFRDLNDSGVFERGQRSLFCRIGGIDGHIGARHKRADDADEEQGQEQREDGAGAVGCRRLAHGVDAVFERSDGLGKAERRGPVVRGGIGEAEEQGRVRSAVDARLAEHRIVVGHFAVRAGLVVEAVDKRVHRADRHQHPSEQVQEVVVAADVHEFVEEGEALLIRREPPGQHHEGAPRAASEGHRDLWTGARLYRPADAQREGQLRDRRLHLWGRMRREALSQLPHRPHVPQQPHGPDEGTHRSRCCERAYQQQGQGEGLSRLHGDGCQLLRGQEQQRFGRRRRGVGGPPGVR